MNPFITRSVAAEQARDLHEAAQHHRDIRMARDPRLRQRRVPRITLRALPTWLRLRTS